MAYIVCRHRGLRDPLTMEIWSGDEALVSFRLPESEADELRAVVEKGGGDWREENYAGEFDVEPPAAAPGLIGLKPASAYEE